MAGYTRSKGYVRSRSQIRKSLQRINPNDHQRRRADTVRVRNPIPYNAAYYGDKLHCDQNEKLSRYGCTLFAFNDGCSSKIVRTFCMPKKNATASCILSSGSMVYSNHVPNTLLEQNLPTKIVQ